MATAAAGAAGGGFEFPQMYSWPPFFTLQTHDASWQKQYAVWSQLIRDYCKAKRIFVLSVNDASTSELFTNSTIGRALPTASIVKVLDRLVLEGYGAWEDGGKERCKIYWRKPEEWADMIAQRVVDCGFQDQVFTIFDVLHGDFSADTELFEMDEGMLNTALLILEEREPQKAALFDDDETPGVKFF